MDFNKEARQKTAETIKKLLNMTIENGCTENEAMIAAKQVASLLRKYNLTLDEVSLSQEEFIQKEIFTGNKSKRPVGDLVGTIAYFTDCMAWSSKVSVRDEKGRFKIGYQYTFFGTAQDVAVAHYLYRLLEVAISNSWRTYSGTFIKPDNRSYMRIVTNFRKGIVDRLSSRLQEMKREQEADKNKQQQAGLVLADKMVVVKNKFAELSLDLRKSKSRGKRTIADAEAYYSGVEAADKVNINKGLESKKTENQKLLGS